MKLCTSCNLTKDLKLFRTYNTIIGVKRISICNQCKAVKDRDYLLKHKEEINTKRRNAVLKKKEKAVQLKGGKCSRCSEIVHIAAYDFHHIQGVKEKEISKLFKRKWDIILAELEKCVLLCSNCHRITHWEEINDY